jgi:hypothetical protein
MWSKMWTFALCAGDGLMNNKQDFGSETKKLDGVLCVCVICPYCGKRAQAQFSSTVQFVLYT